MNELQAVSYRLFIQLSNRTTSEALGLDQCFSNHGSRPKSGSPRLCGWVAKACELPRVIEKDLRAQGLRSEEPS